MSKQQIDYQAIADEVRGTLPPPPSRQSKPMDYKAVADQIRMMPAHAPTSTMLPAHKQPVLTPMRADMEPIPPSTKTGEGSKQIDDAADMIMNAAGFGPKHRQYKTVDRGSNLPKGVGRFGTEDEQGLPPEMTPFEPQIVAGLVPVFHGTKAKLRWYDDPDLVNLVDSGEDVPGHLIDRPLDKLKPSYGGLKMMDGMGIHAGTPDAANQRLETNVGQKFGNPKRPVDPKRLSESYVMPLDGTSNKPFTKADGTYFTETELQSRLSSIAKKLGFEHTRNYSAHYGTSKIVPAQKAVKQYLKDQGYDSIPYVNSHEDRGSTSWIFFESDQLKPKFSEPTPPPRLRDSNVNITQDKLGTRIALKGDDSLPAIKGNDKVTTPGIGAGEVGYITLGEPVGDYLNVDMIYVRRANRGKGSSTDLYKAAIDEAKKRGYKGIASSQTNRSSMATNAIWEKYGTGKLGEYDVMEEWKPKP